MPKILGIAELLAAAAFLVLRGIFKLEHGERISPLSVQTEAAAPRVVIAALNLFRSGFRLQALV
jgi:hypothetical protein